MEDTINRIFDKLENADVSPSANYSMPEYYMHCAMRGREKEKRLLFRWLSMSLGIDVDLINKVFNERYGNVQNESRNMRRTIQLRESELKRMIAESVRRALNEAGHLYWRDEEGNAHSNSKDLYRGVPGAILVSHGEWSDPEILYKGKEINYYDVEDGLWMRYNDFMNNESEEEKAEFSRDMGVDAVPDNEDVYEKFIEWCGGVEFVQEELDNCVWAMNGNP